ncbi:FKBP-type peptidyl-prolyl cis-trans isomerase [Paraferrimonas sp. SM1919]|uniref:FKBP-type peptidyl-prolyl cis-trans isomerase n=1 Tax=Paraferrimonas sp. SM1919 TaxID=2662263 RepID=UPI0013D58B86|nr:FKBP-type peptidyl-prolyl cis-trans isomerase [Paraferrimonas sp. SM1919]
MKVLLTAMAIALIAFYFYSKHKNDKVAAENQVAAQAFLQQNAKDPNVITTSSGLQYKVLVDAEGPKPSASSNVEVHYHGTLIDGQVFDSSVERGQTISFGLNQVIPGWTEGLQLMSVGSKYQFFIPAHLAYGNRNAGIIKPGSLLIFEVELFSIK